MTNNHNLVNLINSLPAGDWKATVGGPNSDIIFLTCPTHAPLMYQNGQLKDVPIRRGYNVVTDNLVFIKGTYKNYQGKVSQRTIMPLRVLFKATDYHPDQQWILDAFDLDKSAERSFALKDFNFANTGLNEEARRLLKQCRLVFAGMISPVTVATKLDTFLGELAEKERND